MNEEKKSVKMKSTASTKKTGSNQSGKKALNVFKTVWRYIWMFRGAIISIPVLVVAIGQAFRNASRLPDVVGLNIQATGEYAMTVGRPAAVVIPLLVTVGCILLTCFTKRPLFPWLISIFTLVIPVLIWIINSYPA